MIDNWPLLSVLIFLPLVGVFFILICPYLGRDGTASARWIALLTAAAAFGLSLLLWWRADPQAPTPWFAEDASWLPALGWNYQLGVDGISLPFILLATFLTLICVISAWHSTQSRVRAYLITFLLLETFMIGAFSALNIFLFYIFFEGILIPMFLIIGIWGGERRVYAAFKFFLYTLAGSVFLLLALLAIFAHTGESYIFTLHDWAFTPRMQFWLWLAFFASFAVKVPMWPFHTWLPDAHVQAPTGGSVILAGILLKLGAYGFLRFSIPMLPEASTLFTPLVFTLSAIAVVYTSLVALAQDDMKKLIAYSSVAHMGFVTAGIFAQTPQAINGALFQMVSHGLVSAALFLIVGVLYDRTHSHRIADFQGLARPMPVYASFFMLFTLASVGLPGTSGFVGEFLVIIGTFPRSSLLSVVIATTMVLGAAYMLWLYRRVIFDDAAAANSAQSSLEDLLWRERLVFLPFIFLVIWLGLYPRALLSYFEPSLQPLTQEISAPQLPPDSRLVPYAQRESS